LANTTYAATHQKTITIDGAYSGAQIAIMTLNLTPQYYSTSRDFAIIENDPTDISAIETTFQADFDRAAITPPIGDDLVRSPTNSQTPTPASGPKLPRPAAMSPLIRQPKRDSISTPR
jgi:cardiolipin synthase A/B